MTEAASTRRDDLRALRDDLQARMAIADSDQNFAVMGRLLVDVLKQLDESADSGPKEGSVLSEFQQRLKDRESGAARSRRTKS